MLSSHALLPRALPTCRSSARQALVSRPVVKKPLVLVRVAETATAEAAPQHAITLSDKAVSHIQKLKQENGSDNLLLRVGVKQGGCSGMSYVMDFEKEENVKEDDYIIQYDGFKMACDPKSLLYLFGMNLDYSDALIGGGFQFSNPNATDNCGCGKSFSV